MPPSFSDYDVVIIGAGPAGLTCLSAIREPYSLDHLSGRAVERAHHSMKLHRQLSVCVIDPQPEWMNSWKKNFAHLRIDFLRSPAMAHPDTFDQSALLAYACMTGGEEKELLESGCSDIKRLISLGQTQVGLWKLPSTKLFVDFCDHLVEKLPHRRIQGHVVDIDDCGDARFRVTWKSNQTDATESICTRNVIVATGMSGREAVPRGLQHCPSFSWKDPQAFPPPVTASKEFERILVVGGGLTAVQAAIRVVRDGHACVLCSRRPIQERHFDIPVEWFDIRATNRKLSKIYHDSLENRLGQIKEARDGGSVPPWYMKQLNEFVSGEHLSRWVGEINCVQGDGTDLIIRYEGVEHKFDRLILACGVIPDASSHPVLANLQQKWPIGSHGGLPNITQDLQWGKNCPNIFVVGAMAALQVGPDAGNLMGIRRAADKVAFALECRCWLREKTLTNPFVVLDDSETDDSDEDSL